MPPVTLWPVTLWFDKDSGKTNQANLELTNLLGEGVFENPKPVALIKKLLTYQQAKMILSWIFLQVHARQHTL